VLPVVQANSGRSDCRVMIFCYREGASLAGCRPSQTLSQSLSCAWGSGRNGVLGFRAGFRAGNREKRPFEAPGTDGGGCCGCKPVEPGCSSTSGAEVEVAGELLPAGVSSRIPKPSTDSRWEGAARGETVAGDEFRASECVRWLGCSRTSISSTNSRRERG